MPECFCGCGRNVRGLGVRGMNKNGRRTAGLLTKLRTARELVAETATRDDPDWRELGDDLAELLDGLIEEGEEFEAFWMAAMHGDYLPPPAEARQIKQHFNAWGRRGMATCRKLGVPISRSGAFSGRV